MSIRALVAALSPLQIKANSAFLDRNSKNSLRAFYIAGVLIRGWVLYQYATSVAGTISEHMLLTGWGATVSAISSYTLAALIALLALLALRNWIAGMAFIFAMSVAAGILSATALGGVDLAVLKRFVLSSFIIQTLYLLPLMLLQFSMFKSSALKSGVNAVSASRKTHAPNPVMDDFNEIKMMDGEGFYDMRTSNY